MKRTMVPAVALALVVVAAAVGLRGQGKPSVVQPSPEWEKLKTLVGYWEGVMDEGGKPMPVTAEVRMTGDGSAIMHVLGPGTPHEMVTMFHPDGKRLLGTHYCSSHNQPRLVGVPAKAANQVAFGFLDGTNIAPGDGHINGVTFTFVDADRHEEAWTHSSGPGGALFKFTRKKK
jgi:hypothetical protein